MVRRVLVAAVFPVVTIAASCLGPTEVMVTITTNACGTLARTDVYVGSSASPVTSTGGCTSGQTVGTIAVLPSSGVDHRIDITVVGAVGDACSTADTQDAKCIVARRSLSFIPHQRLDLPIFLDTRCANMPCGSEATCVAEPTPHCESKQCDVDGGIVCEGDASGPPDDAQTIDVASDAPSDAPPGCPVIVQGTPVYSWSFDATDAVHEDTEAFKPEPFTGGSIGKNTPFCGNYLQAPAPQTLASGATKLATKTFTIGFAYAATIDGTLIRLGSLNLNTGFTIGIAQGQLVVDFQKVTNVEVYRDGVKTTDGKWHTAIVDIVTTLDDAGTPSSTVRVTRDNVVGKVAGTPFAYPVSADTMSVGPVDAIDQVSYFGF